MSLIFKASYEYLITNCFDPKHGYLLEAAQVYLAGYSHCISDEFWKYFKCVSERSLSTRIGIRIVYILYIHRK